MNTKKPGALHHVILVLSAVTLFFSLITAFALFHKETISSQVIKFNLVDHENYATTEERFSGEWLLVYFGFTNCVKVCPVQMSVMKRVLEELDESNHSELIKPILITVDPKRDTPEVMKKYLAHFDSRIVGLTGTEQEIQSLLKLFSAFSLKTTEDSRVSYEVIHPDFFYLVNPAGQISERFSADQDSIQLAKNLRNELQTSSEML